MKALYDVPAPAKINRFLHVVGRRPDGYHLLQSVFLLIRSESTRLNSSHPRLSRMPSSA